MLQINFYWYQMKGSTNSGKILCHYILIHIQIFIMSVNTATSQMKQQFTSSGIFQDIMLKVKLSLCLTN
jgi:hypothetical protein